MTVDPLIHLESVRASYGGPLVIDGIDASIARGEFVSIVGPSGCGKSTLLSVIAGLKTPDDGCVEIAGSNAAGRPGRCAYMPQHDMLFPWRTVLGNAALGLEARGVRRREARARAAELFEPFGLTGCERARPRELSGGMRQRAALLRTVVQGCEVLLLDEPFGALDALTRVHMQRWMQEMRSRFGWTVVLVTHDVREAVFLSDRVLQLSPRPASVEADLPIALAYPRADDAFADPAFVAAETELFARIGSARGLPAHERESDV